MGALLLLQAANYIAPLVVLLYLTRVLGAETYGVVAFSIGIAQLAIVLTDFGFDLSATHKISVWRDKKRYVARFIGAIFFVKLVVFALVAAAIVAYAFLSEKYSDHIWLFLFSILPVLGFSYQPVWFFAGIERMKYITIFSIIAKSLYVVLIILLISDESDYLLVPLANGVAQLVAMVAGILFIYSCGYRISLPRWRDVSYAVKLTRGVFLSRLSVAVYMSCGTVLLGIFSTPLAVATYSLAEQLYRAMQMMFQPIVQAVYPYMAKEKSFSLFFKIAAASVFLAILGACAVAFIAPYVIPLVLGQQWAVSLPVLNVFLVAIVVNVMTMMSGYPLAVAINRLDIANRSVFYGSVIYFLLAGALIVSGHAIPWLFAAIMVVSEFCVLVYRGVLLLPKVHRVQKIKFRGCL